MLITLFAIQASAQVVLEGTRTDAHGREVPYTMSLDDSGRFEDSLRRIGTWSMTQEGTGRTLNWMLGTSLRGSIPEAPDNCWAEASSPLNPDLGSINVCLATALQVLRPYSASCETNFLWTTGPGPGEEGHWAAGRLTPTSANGMWIHRVRYYLTAGLGDCGQLDHRVQVFLGAAEEDPPATPNVLYEFDVDGSSLAIGDTFVELVLPSYVFVDGDESLFVSLEQLDFGDGQTCPAVCITDPVEDGFSYWSNSASTPYPWTDLSSFDIQRLMISGYGIVAP
jgi:hypothetical protein